MTRFGCRTLQSTRYIPHITSFHRKTPFEPSRYPGAGSYRLCTVAQFLMADKKRKFTVFNTHLDDQSEEQRQVGVSLILHRARYEAIMTGWPVFLLGDLNRRVHVLSIFIMNPSHPLCSPAEGEDTGAYRIVTGAEDPLPINETFTTKYSIAGDQMKGFKMLDLRGQTPPEKVSSNFATFTGFTKPGDAAEWKRIDFIFGGDTRGWCVFIL